MFSGLFGRGKKTFKPVKNHKAGSKQAELHEYAKYTLGSGDVKAAVALPPGESLEEWIATNTVDMYNTVSILYGVVADNCTAETCPTMSAGSRFEFLWADKIQRKPIRVTAPIYVDNLMTWIENQLDDESLFPTRSDSSFPPNFMPAVKKIWSRLFRVIAHTYHHHFEVVISLSAEKHLNSTLKHFVYFALTFDLMEPKEFSPLSDLIDELTDGFLSAKAEAKARGSTTSGATTTSVPQTTTERGKKSGEHVTTSSHGK